MFSNRLEFYSKTQNKTKGFSPKLISHLNSKTISYDTNVLHKICDRCS